MGLDERCLTQTHEEHRLRQLLSHLPARTPRRPLRASERFLRDACAPRGSRPARLRSTALGPPRGERRALHLRSTEAGGATVLRRTEGAPRGRGRCGGGTKGQEAEEGPREGEELRGEGRSGGGAVSHLERGGSRWGAGLRSPEGGGGLPEHVVGVRGTTDRHLRGRSWTEG